VSTWTFEDDYTCLGECSPAGCNGHEAKLLIQDTSDTFAYYHDKELKACGPIEELQQLGSLMMQAGDAGVIS